MLKDPNGNPVTGSLFQSLGTPCPMVSRAYVVGGQGQYFHDTEDRKAGKITLTERFKAAGTHEVKAGIDVENNTDEKARVFSGGAEYENDVNGNNIQAFRWVTLGAAANPDPRFSGTCTTPAPPGVQGNLGMGTISFNPTSTKGTCAFTSGVLGSPGTLIQGDTLNWAAYARDSWQIRPNFTLNLGLRYEEQYLRYASFLQDTTDPLTGNFLGKNAMVLTGNFSPRLGIIYDPTKEGRSKFYASFGRFYESIPSDINDRSFGGEVQYLTRFLTGTGNQCGPVDPRIGGPSGAGCLNDYAGGTLLNQDPNKGAAGGQQLIGASGELVAPGIQAQYMDEIIFGLEYEILDDLKLGLAYENRQLGRVIEDVSTDGANTYIIANPGTWSTQDEQNLENEITHTDDPNEKARLTHELDLFRGIRQFDHPTRDYNQLQFTLTRRFSKKLYVQGSYTYSRIEGNYPGLISYDNGQYDPNISSQFDLIELLENRVGPLPTDRPHYIKLDGYRIWDFKQKGALTVGARFRALSGIPEQALGPHYLYGADESFLLPRGELGRSDFSHSLDLHAGYQKALPKNMKLELLLDVFNVYDDQGTFQVDNTYAPLFRIAGPGQNISSQQAANPVTGGTYSDLIWVKTIVVNNNQPQETAVPISRNPNFHNPISRYAPTSTRLGVRLSF